GGLLDRALPARPAARYHSRLLKNRADGCGAGRAVTNFLETTSSAAARIGPGPSSGISIETRQSWGAACIVLGLLSISYGSPLLAIVGLKPIAEDLGTTRQLVALASALTWLGTGLGGILMGWVAERRGVR